MYNSHGQQEALENNKPRVPWMGQSVEHAALESVSPELMARVAWLAHVVEHLSLESES